MQDRGATIGEIFERACGGYSNHRAAEQGTSSITYGELNARANQLAHYLISEGVGRGTIVGILLERSIDQLIALLAVCKTGAAYLPLGIEQPSGRLAYILENAAVQIVISRLGLSTGVPTGAWRTIDFAGAQREASSCPTGSPPCDVHTDDVAFCIYTSGSTGEPKGVMVTSAGISDLVIAQRAMFNVSSADRIFQFASFSFDAFLFDVLMAFGAGAALVLRSEEPGEALVEEMKQHGVTIATLPPSLLSRMHLRDVASLRCVIVAGEACPPNCVDSVPSECEFFNAYGPTEATIWSTAYRVPRGGVRAANIPIGLPVGTTGVHILDERLNTVPQGSVGEIYLTGPALARGYRNRPDLTAEKFLPHPDGPPGSRMYKSGDLGRWTDIGQIEFMGRVDHQVKLRGFRIELGEVERVLVGGGKVRAAAVLAQGVEPARHLAGFLEGPDLKRSDLPGIEAALNQKLPPYMIPARWAILEQLPLNASGKIDRQALRQVATHHAVGRNGYVEPQTQLEQSIADIWADVLQFPGIGRTDGFRRLGGSSIQAIDVGFRLTVLVGRTIAPPRGDQTLSDYAMQVEAAVGASVATTHDGDMQVDVDGLSFAQEQVCFMEAAGDAWRAYRCHARLNLKGPLDLAAMQQALNRLVMRHDILRTGFVQEQGKWRRCVVPTLRVPLPCTDLSHLDREDRDAALDVCVREELDRKFDLAAPPLVHWRLIRLQMNEHVLLQSEHHNVHDGQSFRILLRDLSALYSEIVTKVDAGLPVLECGYGNYCIDEQRWLQSTDYGDQLAAWQRQLNGYDPDVMPFSKARTNGERRYAGGQERHAIGSHLFEGLGRLAVCLGVTRYALMFAAFGVLCARLSQQGRFLVGSALANRTSPRFKQTVGMFVNMLPIPFDVVARVPFADLVRQTEAHIDFALTYSRVPLAEIVKQMNWSSTLRGQPPFNLGFSFHDSMAASPQFDGLEVQLDEALSNGSAKFDLSVVGVLANGTSPHPMELLFEYDSDVFDHSTIERVVGHFKTLLDAVVANPQCRVQDLPLLTEAERRQILVEWNDTKADFPQDKCIHQLFEEQVERSPDAVAVVFEDQQLTYKQLNAKANQLAHYLRGLGVRPDTLVAICVERSLEMVIGLLGILKASGAYVPLDPDYPEERLAFMLQDTAAPVLLTQAHLKERVPQTESRIVCIDSEWGEIGNCAATNPQNLTAPMNLVYCIYTSGSTGRPKGAINTHAGLSNLLQWYFSDALPSSKLPQRVMLASSLSFDLTQKNVVGPLAFGGTLIIAAGDVTDVQGFGRVLGTQRPTRVNCAPSAYRALLSTSALPEGATVVLGGEPIDAALARSVAARGLHLVNSYGPTECADVAVYFVNEEGSPRDSIPLGRAIPHVTVYLLDEHLNPVPIGVSGELHISGMGVSRGYLNRPDLTAEKFIPNPFGDLGNRMYKTGDLARYLPDGNIEFLGRIDHQVKIRGFRIELGEIESALQHCKGVREVVVLAREDESGDKRLVAYVVPVSGTLSVADLRAQLSTFLPEYMVPTAWVFLDALPLNPNGKVDRRQLLARAQDAKETVESTLQTAMLSHELQEVLKILRELLPGIAVGPEDDLIARGLHSLAVLRFVSRCGENLGVELKVRDVYRLVTPSAIAENIQAARICTWPV